MRLSKPVALIFLQIFRCFLGTVAKYCIKQNNDIGSRLIYRVRISIIKEVKLGL